MRALASDAAHLILDVVRDLGAWMSFNAFLATVPAVLAVLLFHRTRAHTVAWWLGVVAFVLFLPNAPYVVTDLIHAGGLVDRFTGSSRLSSLVPLAAIGALVVYGLGAYAICLAEVDRELVRAGRAAWRVPVRTVVHLLCAFGVVLGRLPRLNSWYVVTRPDAVVEGVGAVARPMTIPVVLVLAVGFALGSAAVAAVGRAAWTRLGEVRDAGRRGAERVIGPA